MLRTFGAEADPLGNRRSAVVRRSRMLRML
jgi:hypothetical protein